MVGWFLMFLARLANFTELSVSRKASIAGEIIPIIVVLQLPPNESSNNRVILESLYGICVFYSISADITLPKQLNDWLIFFDSSNLRPVAPVTRTLSLPAKSTRLSLPTLIDLWLSISVIYSTMMMKTAWDLLLTSFIFVLAVALDAAPFDISE